MPRLSPLDLSFLALESSSRPMHAGAIMLFDPPDDGDCGEMVERTLSAFRSKKPAAAPWNVRPVLGFGSLPHWQHVSDVDMDYHVRRVDLPVPGSTHQLMELVGYLYPALLDRSRPLWEAYVIAGLEGGRMAVFVKGHHSLADGVSGARMFHASLSSVANDDPRPLWAVASGARSAPPSGGRGELLVRKQAVKRVAGLAADATRLARLVPDGLRLVRSGTALPFSAAKTPTMAERISPARSFAIFDLPLAEVKRVGKLFGGTVNDVVLSVCDDAMQRYLAESGGNASARMVAMMAVSTRREGDHSTSNAATGTLVALGQPDSSPSERLAQVVDATVRIKSAIGRTSALPLQLQAISLLGALELRERLPLGRGVVPHVANFTLSNVPGAPKQALYLGRARLAGFYAVPIVPPAQAANFTVLTYEDSLCIGIGAARNIVPDTARLAQLATTSFEALRATTAQRTSV